MHPATPKARALATTAFTTTALAIAAPLATALATIACEPVPSDPMTPHHAHGATSAEAHAGHHHGHHHHGDGPLVHRFQDASEWAKVFDDPEREAWQKPSDVVALLALSPGMKVADVGAGTGYFEAHLSRAVGPTGRVFALDVEDSMVRYLQDRAVREGLTNVTASKVPFDDPQLPANGIDRILIVDTWHHIADRPAYAAKLRAALAPGGFVAIVDFTLEATHGPPKEHRIPPDQAKTELEGGGLVTEIASETLSEQYVVIGRLPAK